MVLSVGQYFDYPGIGPVRSAAYTCSRGITPGVCSVVTYPIPGTNLFAPLPFGNMQFGDGVNTRTIRNCRVDSIDPSASADGSIEYCVRIFDRRWRWSNPSGGLAAISGRYNQTDKRKKLIPWSIRSPVELATLCFNALNETQFTINLPNGLTSSVGKDIRRYLQLGENFPQTTCNPETNWDYIPPAQALSALCEMFGCVIAYQPLSDKFTIMPQGVGKTALPTAQPYEILANNVSIPNIPSAIGVVGSPTRYQMRLSIEAVGEEWDGSYVPIDLLSYAPLNSPAQNWRGECQFIGSTLQSPITTDDLTFIIDITDVSGKILREEIEVVATEVSGPAASSILSGIASLLEDNDNFNKTMTVRATGNFLIIDAKNNSIQAKIMAYNSLSGDHPNPWVCTITRPRGQPLNERWKSCPPPFHFNGPNSIRATSRLAYSEALALAQKSVFRCYRITDIDPSDPTKTFGLTVPKYGEIDRIQQLILNSTKAEQAIPTPRIDGGINAGDPLAGANFNAGILPEFYNGYSRDQQATVRGSIYKLLPGLSVQYSPFPFNNTGVDLKSNVKMNTNFCDRVFMPFAIETVITGDTLIVFGSPVYEYDQQASGFAYVKTPTLTVETALYVLDPLTDTPDKYIQVQVLGGDALQEWHHHDDIQVTIIGEYPQISVPGMNIGAGAGYGVDESLFNGGNIEDLTPGRVFGVPDDPTIASPFAFNKLKGWHYGKGDLADAQGKAKLYLQNHAKRYQLTGGSFAQYIGHTSFEPDGNIHQVTWSVGDGATTVYGLGYEFSPWIPTAAERRRDENLAPDALAAKANLDAQAAFDKNVKREIPK